MVVRTLPFCLSLKLPYSCGIKLLSRADTVLQPEGNAEERTPLLENNTIMTSPPSSSTLVSIIEGYESDHQDTLRPFKKINTSYPLIHDQNAASIIRGVILSVGQPF